MTGYKRGDVILVSFIFSDEAGIKRRPAVVISSESYNQKRQEAVISAITSRTDRLLVGDYIINNWQESGLLLPSVVTGIIRTIKQSMISIKLGAISPEDMKGIDKQLQLSLELYSR